MYRTRTYDVLVTGACGFLGSHVVLQAVQKGLSVLATARIGAVQSRLKIFVPGCPVSVLDVTASSDVLVKAAEEARAVIHCAAYGVDYRRSDFNTALLVNVAASVQLLSAVAKAGARFVHIGTAYEYGPSDKPLDESCNLAPRGVYGVTKAAGTLAVLDRAAACGAQAVVLRPFGMYGPLEDEHKLVPLAMRSMLAGTPLELTPGRQLRDYVYVGDVADACLAAATARIFPSGQIINLASGVELELREFVNAAAIAIDGDISLLRWGARPYRADEVMRVVGTCKLAEELLAWTPTTSLLRGMAKTAAAERSRVRLKT